MSGLTKDDEANALKALRDSTSDLVKYLDAVNGKILLLNEQNELSLRVLENWNSAFAITNALSQHNKRDGVLTKPTIFKRPSYKLDTSAATFDRMKVLVLLILLESVLLIYHEYKQAFNLMVLTLLPNNKLLSILLPNTILTVVMISMWLYCEICNPSIEKSGRPTTVSCLRVPKKATRYCTICCKTSPGLDHHCTWLNTCIGEVNYEAFFYLVIAATIQTMLQATIGFSMVTYWKSEVKNQLESLHMKESKQQNLFLLIWFHNFIITGLFISFALLLGFHTYLIYVGTGTYDFILENGDEGICVRLLSCKWFKRNSKKKNRNHVITPQEIAITNKSPRNDNIGKNGVAILKNANETKVINKDNQMKLQQLTSVINSNHKVLKESDDDNSNKHIQIERALIHSSMVENTVQLQNQEFQDDINESEGIFENGYNVTPTGKELNMHTNPRVADDIDLSFHKGSSNLRE